MSFLLDTNVVSELTRLKPDGKVAAWIDSIDEDEAFLSVISIAELRRGIQLLDPGRNKAAIEAWFHDDLRRRFEKRILDITPAIAEAWGDLTVATERSGRRVQAMDGFIAATAKVHGLRIATRNVKDFQMLDVKLLNPWEAHS